MIARISLLKIRINNLKNNTMKKFLLIACLFVASLAVNAQGNVAAVKAKLEKSNTELKGSKGSKSSSWLKNASLYLELAEVNTSQFVTGIPASQLMMMIGKPSNAAAPEIEEINGKAFVIYKYANVNAYIDNSTNMLSYFAETNVADKTALASATKSVLQAYKMDPKTKSKVISMLEKIIAAYTTIADNNYGVGNYEVAATNFEQAGTLSTNDLINNPAADELLYFAVVSYGAAKDIANSKKALDLMTSRNYLRNGDVLYYLAVAESELGNKEAAEATFLRGVQEFPENSNILNSLIAFYLSNNENPNKVIPLIKKAQEANPTNVNLYIAEGLAYDAMKDIPNAIAAYKKAVEIDDSSFDVLYNLGLAYYRMSENIADELTKINYSDTELYNSTKARIDAEQMKSLEILLKAHALNKTDKTTIELIRSIYFRQRNNSPEMKAGYETFDAKSKELK